LPIKGFSTQLGWGGTGLGVGCVPQIDVKSEPMESDEHIFFQSPHCFMFIERQTREIDPNGSGQDEAVHSEQPGIDIVLHAS